MTENIDRLINLGRRLKHIHSDKELPRDIDGIPLSRIIEDCVEEWEEFLTQYSED